MQLSWSHKLFLKINGHIGKNHRLDLFMRFCGKWLVYFIVLFIFFWIIFESGNGEAVGRLWFFVKVVAVSYAISLTIGFVAKKSRPEIEMPTIKQLIYTIGLWKSFSSDHTNLSFLLIFLAIIFGLSVYWYVPLLIGAGLVAVGRVYCGVHYPRDILGGLFLAIAVSLSVNYFFI